MTTTQVHFSLTNGSWIHATAFKKMLDNNFSTVYVLYRNKSIVGILKETLVSDINIWCDDKANISTFRDVD